MSGVEMAFPGSVEEACELLAEYPDSRAIAGGTALMVVMKEGVFAPDRLVNLRDLAEEHAYVREDGDRITIGALTTMRDVERSPVIAEALPVVVDCLREIAGVRVRNSATLGGHLAHADVHLDLPPVLAGYGAEVVISDGQTERSLPIEAFMRGYYETALAPDELITAVTVPVPPAGTRGTYRKHRYYSAVDWPCVGVAAFAEWTPDGVEDVRVLLNSVGSRPVLRLDGVEDALDGSLSDDGIAAVGRLAADQATPIGDLRGSAAYKERMARVFTERALRDLREA